MLTINPVFCRANYYGSKNKTKNTTNISKTQPKVVNNYQNISFKQISGHVVSEKSSLIFAQIFKKIAEMKNKIQKPIIESDDFNATVADYQIALRKHNKEKGIHITINEKPNNNLFFGINDFSKTNHVFFTVKKNTSNNSMVGNNTEQYIVEDFCFMKENNIASGVYKTEEFDAIVDEYLGNNK